MSSEAQSAQNEMGPDQVEFEPRAACPFHGDAGADPQAPLDLFGTVEDQLTHRSFRIWRCPRCGAGLTDPFPTEATVAWLYQGRGSTSNFDPIRGSVVDRLKDFFARVDLKRIHATGGRPELVSMLDYGTGNGRFAMVGRRSFAGCAVDAVDFDPQPPPALLRDGIRYLSVEAFGRESKRYDLILLRHLVEHVHDPVAFLRSMADRLSPDGIMYIEVPNLESANIKLFGRRTNAYSVPYHLFHFDAKSLHAVCRSAGLDSRISEKGMPLSGGILAALLHQERTLAHQLAGVALHPVQMLLDGIYGKPCLAAVCTLSPGLDSAR
jgi:SAM-dependent methyltransferase